MAKVTAVSTVFPYAGLLRFLLSPKNKTKNQKKELKQTMFRMLSVLSKSAVFASWACASSVESWERRRTIGRCARARCRNAPCGTGLWGLKLHAPWPALCLLPVCQCYEHCSDHVITCMCYHQHCDEEEPCRSAPPPIACVTRLFPQPPSPTPHPQTYVLLFGVSFL